MQTPKINWHFFAGSAATFGLGYTMTAAYTSIQPMIGAIATNQLARVAMTGGDVRATMNPSFLFGTAATFLPVLIIALCLPKLNNKESFRVLIREMSLVVAALGLLMNEYNRYQAHQPAAQRGEQQAGEPVLAPR